MLFLIRLLVNAAALWVAIRIVPGITYEGDGFFLLFVALVFGMLNAFVRPIVQLLTLPLLLFTLGLFTLVINALMLWLTGVISGLLGLGFHVAGFWSAFLGGLVVAIVSMLLSIFVWDQMRVEWHAHQRRRRF